GIDRNDLDLRLQAELARAHQGFTRKWRRRQGEELHGVSYQEIDMTLRTSTRLSELVPATVQAFRATIWKMCQRLALPRGVVPSAPSSSNISSSKPSSRRR